MGKCIKRIRYGTIRFFESYQVTKSIDDPNNFYVDLYVNMQADVQATCKHWCLYEEV